MSTRLAVFDCDGTLVDGQAEVCLAMERAFAATGHPAPGRQAVRRAIGLSLPNAVRGLLPDADEAHRMQVVQAYKNAFRAAREEGALAEPLFDGIEELLRALHADGWKLAVATGKSSRGLRHCLAQHGIADLFASTHTADDHPSKPHPAMLEAALAETGAAPGDAVMIGDTTYDMDMAVAAGVCAIGVGWGYHAPDELRASGAQAVAQDVAALEALLRG